MRKFKFNGMILEDPNPQMTPEEVAAYYATLHAELTNVTVKGPTKDADGNDVYEFKKQVGQFG